MSRTLAVILHPALLYAGLAAVAVPVAIHLLARRRVVRLRWAAMSFIVEAERFSRGRMKMEEALLLALRCLAVLLFALAVARPIWEWKGLGSLLSKSARTTHIVLVDDSLSMSYGAEGETTWDQARRSAARLLAQLRARGPEGPVTLMSGRPDEVPWLDRDILDDAALAVAAQRLEDASPTQLRVRPETALEWTGRTATASGDAGQVIVYVISDFQRADWVAVPEVVPAGGPGRRPGSDGPLTAALRHAVGSDRTPRVVLVDVGDERAENLTLSGLKWRGGQVVAGLEGGLEIAVTNHTGRDVGPLEVRLAVAGQARASAVLDSVPAGQSATTVTPLTFSRSGPEHVRAELSADLLPGDNTRYLAVDVQDALRILLVNGEPSGDAYLDEVHLLSAALGPAGSVASGNKVDVITEGELDGADLAPYHLVMLANVYRPGAVAADHLHEYVAAGGGLAIFPGDQVVDLAGYNLALYRDGRGLLPAELRQVVSAGEEGVTLAAGDAPHPVVRVFQGADNPFLNNVVFYKYLALEPAGTDAGDGAREGPDETRGAARPAAEVVAVLADAERSPAIVGRAYGRGRVLLFASACDLEWNDWARNPSYVVMVQEMVQYLARADATRRGVTVGEPLVLPVDGRRFQQEVTLLWPGNPPGEETVQATPRGPAEQWEVRWPATGRAGFYEAALREVSGREVLQSLVCNVDPREGDLRGATEEELRAAFSGLPVDYVADPQSLEGLDDENRSELWPLLLLATGLVLLLEQGLAWRFGRLRAGMAA